jgi:hypothetical protein
MRTFWLIAGCVLGLLTETRPAAAQTMVEAGAAGSAAATAATGAKGVSTGIGGAFESLGKTLNQAQDPSPKVVPVTKTHSVTAAPAKPKKDAAPPPSYEDAMGIEKGMSCEEVTRRFGPPAMSFAGEADAKTMSYASKSGGVQVECEGGKVAAVDKPR